MSDPAPGRSGQPGEARCYNCGGTGHWTVACHEPTRDTPAGLAAWRNASSAKQDHSRPQHNDGRRSKGPIITKYAPPPGTGYPPGYQAPPNYAQPHAQPHAVYSGPSPPQHPPHYPYSHDRPGLPLPPPPGYGQQPYHQPPYPPSAPYGASHAAQPYPVPPPGGAPPPSPGIPPGYGSYPGYGQDSHGPFVPPRPAYSGSYPQSAPKGKRHQQHSPPSNRPAASSPPAKAAAPVTAKSPSLPSAPGAGALSLPPKPPKSVHEFQGPIPDQRNNKRKHDRQNRNKDNRDNRDPKQGGNNTPRNQGSPKGPQHTPNRRLSHGKHGQQPDRRAQWPPSRDDRGSVGRGQFSPPGNPGRRESDGMEASRPQLAPSPISKASRELTQDSSGIGLELSNKGTSSSISDMHHASLPPKPGTTPEKRPAKLNNAPQAAETVAEDAPAGRSASRKSESRDSDRESDSRLQNNGTRSRDTWSDTEESRERAPKRIRHDSRERRKSPSRSPSRHREDELPRRSEGRSRSRQRQPSVGSHRSRSSSASSRSSGLDSLEAELLGRPAKRRQSKDSDTKRKPERSMPTKMKKRRQTNSAFSRRW